MGAQNGTQDNKCQAFRACSTPVSGAGAGCTVDTGGDGARRAVPDFLSEVMEDAPLVESISLGEVASALQLASEEAPDAAEAPANPASPGSDTLPGSAPSPSSPAHSVSAQADQALPRESAKAEVVDSTPPDKAAAADPGASGSVQPNPGPETLEVECREGLRTQWLSFVYRPEECAAATLGRCRDQAAMSSLDTLCVWPDKGELDLGLSLSDSLRPGERRLLATAPHKGRRAAWPAAQGSQ